MLDRNLASLSHEHPSGRPAPSPTDRLQPSSPAVSRQRQREALRAILDRVEALAPRTARGGLRPVVEIDLDLCALMPIHRTQRALIELGRHFGILDAVAPATLPLLPGYSDEAWRAFVAALGLDRRFPTLDWFSRRTQTGDGTEIAAETPFAMFHRLYWDTQGLAEDRPTPGLGAFVHAIEHRGGTVVFISGRWLHEHRGPSLIALRRAGLPRPRLVIGNPRHESTVKPGGRTLGDAQIKAHRQRAILRRYGLPVAVIDDRRANRDAVVEAVGALSPTSDRPLSVAIAIPGFTCDPEAVAAALAISTFETSDVTLGDPPSRRHLNRRYTASGGNAALGLYEGLGGNGLAYVVPRRTQRIGPGLGPEEPHAAGSLPRHFAEIVARHKPGSLDELDFIDLCAVTIPGTERAAIEACLVEAGKLAAIGHAAPFPRTAEARRRLRAALITSWLHARDMQSLMAALGFVLLAEGHHDLREYVATAEVRALVLGRPRRGLGRRRAPSPPAPLWLRRWAASLEPGVVNVGLLNPALLVSMWRWRPEAPVAGERASSGAGRSRHGHRRAQDAMDVHRLSSHHDGDGGERYDPIEAAVNNVLHQREGRLGIRHEPVVGWPAIAQAVLLESGAEALAKSSVGRDVVREACAMGELLEAGGALTPWALVRQEEPRMAP